MSLAWPGPSARIIWHPHTFYCPFVCLHVRVCALCVHCRHPCTASPPPSPSMRGGTPRRVASGIPCHAAPRSAASWHTCMCAGVCVCARPHVHASLFCARTKLQSCKGSWLAVGSRQIIRGLQGTCVGRPTQGFTRVAAILLCSVSGRSGWAVFCWVLTGV